MAELAGAEYHPIPIRQQDLADHFSDAIRQAETLCVNAHGVAKYLLSPPSTLTPDESFHTFVQDTLRGPQLAAMPFFDQRQVVDLLDRLPQMDAGARVANDQVLMLLVSMCVLNEGYRLAA
jgi:asparagine synthase (glutamine-hydrolysing)